MTSISRMSHHLRFVAGVVMLAGLLFGYDQGVIGGALTDIERDFGVSTLVIEVITSWVTLGALLGALAAGGVADRFGRRTTVVGAAILFLLGATVEALAPDPPILVVGRLLVGVGVGVASVATPLYAAEMAPAPLRGTMVSVYQLAITVGIFLAYLADQILSSHSSWRVMLGLSGIPAVLLLIAMLPLPDSAVWYAKVGRFDRSVEAIHLMRPRADATAVLSGIRASLGTRQVSWGELFSRRWRAPLILGVGLALFQQLTGINSIIYYADKIFGAAGFHTPQSQTAATTWSIGAVNVLFTFIAVAYVDRLGRRPLLLAGLVGMAVALFVISVCFAQLGEITAHAASPVNAPSDAGVVMLAAMVVFIASFAFSLGPVVWTVINEIYPSAVRGRGVAVATAVNWGAAWLVTQFFLSLVDWIGEVGTFAFFGAMCLVAFAFVWFTLPETKGKSLEEIQQMWLDRAGHHTGGHHTGGHHTGGHR